MMRSAFLVVSVAVSLVIILDAKSQTSQVSPASQPPPLLDSLGDPLPPGAIGRLGTIRFRHNFFASNIGFSPDGKQIASVSDFDPVRVWDAETGKLLRIGQPDFPFSVDSTLALSPDGKLLASVAEKGAIRLSSAKDDKTVAVLKGHEGRIYALAFSGNGRFLASASAAKAKPGEGSFPLQFIVWDVVRGERVCTLPQITQMFMQGTYGQLAFSHSGDYLVFTAQESLWVWDVRKNRELRRNFLNRPHFSKTAVCFSADSRMLAHVDDDNVVVVETASWKTRCKLETRSKISAMAFSPDGQTLAIVDYRVLRFWDLISGKEIKTTPGHRYEVNALAFSPKGDLLASASEDGTIRVWNYKERKELYRFADAVADSPDWWRFADLSFSADGKLLVLGRVSLFPLQFWDMTTGKSCVWPNEELKCADRAVFSSDGRLFATVIDPVVGDAQIDIWDAKTGKALQRLVGGKGGCTFALSPDGNLLAETSYDVVAKRGDKGVVRIWNTSDGKQTKRFSAKEMENVTAMAFSPDSKRLAFAASRDIRLWDVMKGREIWKTEVRNPPLYALQFSPDGAILLGCGEGEAMLMLDAKTGNQRAEIAHPYEMGARSIPGKGNHAFFEISPRQHLVFAISPDGHTIATGSTDSTILLWDAKTIRGK